MTKLQIIDRPTDQLVSNPRNVRVHTEQQVGKIAQSIRRFGFTNPILIDGGGMVLCGHGRLLAATKLGLPSVPTIELHGLTEAQKRAFVIADNKLGDESHFDPHLLGKELEELLQFSMPDFEITETGFEIAEIDAYVSALHEEPPLNDTPPEPNSVPRIARRGDLWLVGKHRLFCGDARDPLSYQVLMGGELARIIFTDPPYNCPIDGHVSGLGKNKHREFVMAAGEMSDAEFEGFLRNVLELLHRHSVDGSLHYVCMDWRQLARLLAAGGAVFDELKNLCVWNKQAAGMGSFYRSQHELIAVFKHGTAPHVNHVRLGRHGRNRSNVWSYQGMAGFQRGRAKKLAAHSTVKPTAMVADALLDCSDPGDLVLDAFCGSGTTILAAERAHRRCYAIELDERYVDVALHRIRDLTGIEPVNAWTGLTASDTAPLTTIPSDGDDHDEAA